MIVVRVQFDSKGMTEEEIEHLRGELERRMSVEILKLLDEAVLGGTTWQH